MALKSLERKTEPMLDMPMSSSYPSFYVCDEQMPEVAEWEVEGEYTLTVKVRLKSKSQRSNMDAVHTDAELEVLAYELE